MSSAKGSGPKYSEIVAIDVGSRFTKAVCVRLKGAEYVLAGYAIVDTPAGGEKGMSVETLAEHLRKVVRELNTTCRRVALSMGPANAVLTHADLPPMSASELRKMVKLSPKSYLQQELPDHLFDCHVRVPNPQGDTTTLTRRKKSRVLVGAVRRRVVEDVCDAARQAGLVVESVSLGPVGLANAFRLLREDSHPEAVALLDIGSSNSSINLMYQGELVLTRVVNLGSERFADLLMPGSGRGEAGEGEEEVSSEVMQARLQKAILSFAREVDASVGFFSSQYEKPVTELLICGGAARSQFIIQALESELSYSCETWNPARQVTLGLPEARAREVEYDAPQLAVAIGTAVAALRPDAVRINLLAEAREAAEMRRSDPVRRAAYVAVAAVVAVLLWAGCIGWQTWTVRKDARQLENRLQSLQSGSNKSLQDAREAAELQSTLDNLVRQGSTRFLYAPVLDALQHLDVEGIQLQRVQLERSILEETPPKSAAPAPRAPASGGGRTTEATKPAKPKPIIKERVVLTIVGRNYLDSGNLSRLANAISQSPFFRERLRAEQGVLLKGLQSRQVDPSNSDRTFEFFTIECTFTDREMKP